jgi:hypothetical protein
MKSGPAELQRYRAEEIDPRTNAPWKKGEHMPEITEARLKELIEAEEKLSALEGMGVDNWEGYSDAMSELREYRASKKEGEKSE